MDWETFCDCSVMYAVRSDQLFNKRGAFAEFRRLNRGSLASRPGTDHDEIVLFHGLPREYITVAIVESLALPQFLSIRKEKICKNVLNTQLAMVFHAIE